MSATMCGPIHSRAPLDSVVCLRHEVLARAGSVLAEGVGGSVYLQADAVRVNRRKEVEAVEDPVAGVSAAEGSAVGGGLRVGGGADGCTADGVD